MRRSLKFLVAALFLAAASAPRATHAGTIVGGSTMLGTAEVAQLEAWLGQGALTLTNIFTKGVDGTTSAAWHGAVDGQGATFTVLQMIAVNQAGQQVRQVVGGYNPESWNSTEGWHLTPDDADRTGFIFNLATGVVQRQCLTTDPAICGNDGDGPANTGGQYQTYNAAGYGPAFGAGFDLVVFGSLDAGYSYNSGYDIAGGLSLDGARNGLDPNQNAYQWLSVQSLETFAIAPAPETVAAPEPGQLAVLGLGLAGLGFARKRART